MKTRLEQARSRFLGQTDDKEKKHESYEAQTAARPTAGGSARERFLQNGFGKTMTAERERWGQALDTYRKAAPTISPEDSIARAKQKSSTAAPGHVEQDALSTPRKRWRSWLRSGLELRGPTLYSSGKSKEGSSRP